MSGLLEAENAAVIDNIIGRQPGCVDLKAGNVRLLLEKGFVVCDVTPFDYKRATGPDGLEYVESAWREEGYTEVEITELLPLLYPLLRERILALLELAHDSDSSYTVITKEPAFDEFLHHLSQGPVGLEVKSPDDSGYTHSMLVTHQIGSVLFEVYDPNKGVTGSTILRMRRWTRGGFRAYQLP